MCSRTHAQVCSLYKFAYVRMHECARVRMQKCALTLMHEFARVRMHKCARARMHECARVCMHSALACCSRRHLCVPRLLSSLRSAYHMSVAFLSPHSPLLTCCNARNRILAGFMFAVRTTDLESWTDTLVARSCSLWQRSVHLKQTLKM